jgi:hypothetical protein
VVAGITVSISTDGPLPESTQFGSGQRANYGAIAQMDMMTLSFAIYKNMLSFTFVILSC